jgi:hypothetical protein
MLKITKKYLMPLMYIIISFFNYIYIKLICSDIPISLPTPLLIVYLKLQLFIFIVLFLIVMLTELKKSYFILYSIFLSPYLFNIFLGTQEKYNILFEGYRNTIILDFFSAFLSTLLFIIIFTIYKIKK